MSRFLKESLLRLEPYTPGEQPKNPALIKLNTNESPYPPSPKVVAAISGEEVEKLKLYSDPEAKELIKAAATHYGVRETQIMAGNGSDEILAFCFMAYGQNIHFPAISYGFYKVYGAFFSEEPVIIPLGPGLEVNPKDYWGLSGNAIIANPNAPTGMALGRGELSEICRRNVDNLIIVDEAYIDFGGESMVPLIDQYDNLLVIQTLSKSRSLAGARIGLAIGNEEIIRDLNRIKFSFNPYNVNRLSILAGAAAFSDREYFEECCEKIIRTRGSFVKGLLEMGFQVLPSAANFVFVKPPGIAGEAYYQRLRENNILVRHFKDPLIRDFVRITIGTEEQMESLLECSRRICGLAKERGEL